MHPRTKELLQYLDAQYDRLCAAVESVPRERWDVKPTPERWSVVEIIEHLSIVERRIGKAFTIRLAEAKSKGVGPEQDQRPILPTLDMDRVLDRTRKMIAPDMVIPSGKVDADASWAALEQAHAALCAVISANDGLALGEVVYPHPLLGPMSVYQWIAFVGGHEARHAAQVLELREATSSVGL